MAVRNALGLPVAHVGGVGDGVYAGWVDWLEHFSAETRLWSRAQRSALHEYVRTHPYALSFCADEAAQWCGKSAVQVARFVYLQTMASRASAGVGSAASAEEEDDDDDGDGDEDGDAGGESDGARGAAAAGDSGAQLPDDVECVATALLDGFLRPIIARLAARATTSKRTREDVIDALHDMEDEKP